MLKKVFFTLNDFTHSSGGSLRMKGILNTLANNSEEVELLSNIKNTTSFNHNIKFTNINVSFSSKEKRILQFLLGIFPLALVDIIFMNKLKKLRKTIVDNNVKEIIFFEYLDNSIGYYLKSRGVINKYINDIHGMAPNEFENKMNTTVFEKFYNTLRYFVSVKLDKKVFTNADGLIFASKSMKEYYVNLYPSIINKKTFIIPYLLQDEAFEQKIDKKLKKDIIFKYNLEGKRVIFYAGGFKEIGGILDLIDAFAKLKNKNIVLFVLGKGNQQKRIEEKIKFYEMTNKVILAGTIPYEQLRTYQDCADIIVCPDKQNLYSNLIIHLKYFDSLLSSKVVINGSFDSVLEINHNEELSINFEPSNIDSLASKIEYCLDNLNELNKKYKNNKDLGFFKYSNYLKKMQELG